MPNISSKPVTYEDLTERSIRLHKEQMGLDNLEMVIAHRRKVVKRLIEENLDHQSAFWPAPKKTFQERSELLSLYYSNPDMTMVEFARKFNLSEQAISRKISNEMNLANHRNNG